MPSLESLWCGACPNACWWTPTAMYLENTWQRFAENIGLYQCLTIGIDLQALFGG